MSALRNVRVGKIGLRLSYVPWVFCLGLMILKPGSGSRIGALGGLIILASIPLAFIMSIIGVFRDTQKKDAIAGLIISGMAALFFFGMPFWMRWFLR